jgi:hypothetical protein
MPLIKFAYYTGRQSLPPPPFAVNGNQRVKRVPAS